MPVVLRRNAVGAQVLRFSAFRRFKCADGLVDLAESAKHMPVHMKRVSDCRCRARVRFGVRLRLGDAAGIFECMGQVVMGCATAKRERFLKERNRRRDAALAAV